MNTVGKILVILNFLFAVVVGALLVVDLATRTNWKEKYFALKTEADAMKSSRDATVAMLPKLTKDAKEKAQELEVVAQKLKDKDVQIDVMKQAHVEELALRDLKVDDSRNTVNLSKALADRLQQEVGLLKTTINDRELFIIGLEARNKELGVAARNFEAMARTKQITNENLLEQIRDLTREVAKRDSGVAGIASKGEAGMPALKINGKVEKVEGTLVQLSIGTDHGLNANHTLIVYRTRPEPLYLGMVHIVDARPHGSVARFVPPTGAPKTLLKEGDLVTSSLK